jgi:hypothetical protein
MSKIVCLPSEITFSFNDHKQWSLIVPSPTFEPGFLRQPQKCLINYLIINLIAVIVSSQGVNFILNSLIYLDIANIPKVYIF